MINTMSRVRQSGFRPGIYSLAVICLFFVQKGMPGSEPESIRIHCKSPWTLIGIIEDLRTRGYRLPARLDEIEEQVCRKLNFESFFVSGAFRERLAEAICIMRRMKYLPNTPSQYSEPVRAMAEVMSNAPILPVWKTDMFLRDKVLSVGLKAYPYLVDYDGDGLTDLLVGDHDGFIYLYPNHGTKERPLYDTPVRLKSTSTGLDIAVAFNPKLNLADMNGDQIPDLVLGSYDGKPYMLPGESETGRSFDDHKRVFFKSGSAVLDVGNYAYPLVIDWNHDNLPDLLIGEISGKVLLFRNCGTKTKPRFRPPEIIVSIWPDMYPDPAFVDFNGDGLSDLVLGSRDGVIRFFLNIGEERFPRFSDFTLVRCGGRIIDIGRLSHVHAADWDNDGQPDLLVGNDDGEVRVFTGKTTRGNTLSFSRMLLLTCRDKTELIAKVHPVVCFADWNNDNRIDIIAGGEGADVRLYLNQGVSAAPLYKEYKILAGVSVGAEAFSRAGTVEKRYWHNRGLEFITEYLGNAAPEVFDWDGDGDPDLLVGSYTGLIYLYRNIGGPAAPRLAHPVALRAGRGLLRVAAFSTPRGVDWNDDGLPDLISGDLSGRVWVFINTGSRNHPRLAPGKRVKVATSEIVLGPRSIVDFADISRDGLPDLLVGNRFGRVYALINRGRPGQPRFDTVEELRETGEMWKRLYGGGWAGPAGSFPLKWKKGKAVTTLCVEATACPRYTDYDGDGRKELMISHRFGRIFIYRPCQENQQ